MKLSAPFIITPRLLPGLQFGAGDSAGWVSIKYAPKTPQNHYRQYYRYYIDLPASYSPREYSDDDLASGHGGGNLQAGMESLLSFLGAAIESRQYRERTESGRPPQDANIPYEDSSEGLFPPAVLDWAAQFAGDISMAQMEIEETPDLIRE